MKKILFAFALLLVTVLTFESCGGGDKPSGNDAPVHTHSFAEWDLTKKPTCTEDGLKVRYCSCGEKQSEVVVSLGHTPAEAVVEDRVEPTYEEDGSYNLVVRCTTCNEKLSESSHTIPMLKHTPASEVTENYIAATCYAEGSYDSVIYCSDCGAELVRTKHIVDKIAHSPAAAVEENIVDSTCYSVGSKDMVVYCSIPECHAFIEKSSVTIDKKAHTPASAVEENRVNPTYEKDGSYQLVIYCSVTACHEELERTTHTLDMLVHHPGSVVVENEVKATCTNTGSYDEVVYCLDADCGHKELSRKTITTDMIPHTSGSAVEENRTDATCYAEGKYDSVVYCAVCGTELSRATVTLQKIAHSPATSVVENRVEATCTTDGSYDEVVYCSVENCKVQISRANKILAATGHAEVIDPAVEATCTQTGLTEGKHCETCGEIIIKQEIINTFDHNFFNGVCMICGEVYVSQGLQYTLSDDGTYYTLTGMGTCTDKELIIPGTYKGLPVTSIANRAFYNKSIISVVIQNGITTIGQEAFYHCQKLSSVTIPESVVTIYEKAFYECTQLVEVINYSTIDMYKYNTSNGWLTWYALEVHNGPSKLQNVDDCLFYKTNDQCYLVTYIGNATQLTLPNYSDEYVIYSNAFYKNNTITSLIIPDSVTEIMYYAFSQCEKLTNVDFGSGLKEIGSWAFVNCNNFKKIILPDGLLSIGEGSFGGGLKSYVIIPNSVTEIGYEAFYSVGTVYCETRSKPSGWSSNWYSNFNTASQVVWGYYDEYVMIDGLMYGLNVNSAALVKQPGAISNINLVIPETIQYKGKTYTVTWIKDYAFSKTSLSSVVIPDTVVSIGDYAFEYCYLSSITLSKNLVSIGESAFAHNSYLRKIVIPSSVTSIDQWAFADCAYLTIYCKASSKPSGWNTNWNGWDYPVVWGYAG